MGIEQALAVIAQLGTDSPPSLSEISTARDDIARALHTLRAEGSSDLEALMSLRDAYQTAAAAVTEMEAAEQEQAAEVDEVLADIPNPDAPAEDAEAQAGEGAEAVAASTRALSLREAVARLGLTEVREPEPAAAPESEQTFSVVIGSEDRGADASFHDLAHAFAESPTVSKSRTRLARISTEYSPERTLSGRMADNTRLVDSLLSPTAIAAAGGCCSLATPIYDQPVLSSMARPIRDSLTTLGANRGAVDFFPAVCIPDSGVAVWTCEDDALVDPADETTWKPCFEVECEEKQTVQVDAIPVCATVGNFQQRYAPERWEATLEALSALQARVAEVSLYAKMRAGVTTTHTGVATGSTYVNVLNSVALAVASIRQDQRYLDVNLHLWLPDWIRQAIRADLRARRIDDADTIEATDALIASAFSEEGVTVTYSPDIDLIHGESGQLDGPLAPYPATASAVLAPEGYFSFLDGGTLDFGTEIRDHDLNRQNKLSAFAESFEGLLARGCNAKAIDIPVEVCDVAAGCGAESL